MKAFEKKLDLVGPIKLLFCILLFVELNKLLFLLDLRQSPAID